MIPSPREQMARTLLRRPGLTRLPLDDLHRRRISRVAGPLTVALVFALAWQVWAMSRDVAILPTFLEFAAALGPLLTDPLFWHAILVSDISLVVGFLISAGIGIPLGLAMGRLNRFESIMDVYLNIMLTAPVVVLMPIVLMALGLTFQARVAIIVLFAAPFIVVPVRSGLKLIPSEAVEMCRSFGAREPQLWRDVFLPGTLPSLMTGLRQGLAHGMTGLLVVELTLLAAGIGAYLLDLQARLAFDRVFAVAFLVILQALLGIGALYWLEKRLRA